VGLGDGADECEAEAAAAGARGDEAIEQALADVLGTLGRRRGS